MKPGTILSILAFVLFACPHSFAQDNCFKKASVIEPPGSYERGHLPTRKPIAYPHLREADVMWMKRIWRRIDLNEKINHPLLYPLEPLDNRASLYDVLRCSILYEGVITAYSPGPLADNDQFTLPMTRNEVEELLSRRDTVQTPSLDDPDVIDNVVVEDPITAEDIVMYEIKEDWFFDNQRSVMDVRIIGICPIIARFDEFGEFRGYQPLFWIYFPEARPVLANADVFLPPNLTNHLSFDDIFWKRRFNSTIVKESNVYDRSISEYKSGLDAVIEGENIKNKIFNYEHDLWSY